MNSYSIDQFVADVLAITAATADEDAILEHLQEVPFRRTFFKSFALAETRLFQHRLYTVHEHPPGKHSHQ